MPRRNGKEPGIRQGRMPLGDWLEGALSSVGVTSERVEAFLGKPCNCKRRKEKLNQLGAWAARVLGGRTEGAKEYLEGILSQPEEEKPARSK